MRHLFRAAMRSLDSPFPKGSQRLKDAALAVAIIPWLKPRVCEDHAFREFT